MRLRPRQKIFVERSPAALDAQGNTLGIAPTGAAKTIMLSAVSGEVIGDSAAKACVLAHRDELTEQNRGKFARVNPGLIPSGVDAIGKSWAGQVRVGRIISGSTPTPQHRASSRPSPIGPGAKAPLSM